MQLRRWQIVLQLCQPLRCRANRLVQQRRGGAAWATAAGSFSDSLRYHVADASRFLRPAVEAAAAGPAAERLAGLRGRLQGHLQASGLVDGPALLQQLRGSAMWEEQVLLHSKVRSGQMITIMSMHEKGFGSCASACCRKLRGCAAGGRSRSCCAPRCKPGTAMHMQSTRTGWHTA